MREPLSLFTLSRYCSERGCGLFTLALEVQHGIRRPGSVQRGTPMYSGVFYEMHTLLLWVVSDVCFLLPTPFTFIHRKEVTMLADKYHGLMDLANQLHISNVNTSENSGKLQIKGTAPHQMEKDMFWDKIKTFFRLGAGSRRRHSGSPDRHLWGVQGAGR